MAPPPVVTGLSPKEGPPGTRVTIRGEFLGKQPYDLAGLTICGCDCLLSAEWKSANKIIARSGPGKGRGDIVVTTRSGGVGTSTVQFRGYHETIGPMKETAVWVEEAPLIWGLGRRSLSPNSYQQDDPLGLSVEGNDHKFPEEELHEYFPDSSGDLTSENFSPGWFLLENHHATTFNDLKAGLSYLKRKVECQKEGQLSFLKKNVGPVMDQVDTLVIFKEKFENDVREYTSNPTRKLENAIQEAMTEANRLFEDVLARRERADGTRNALTLLTRFRFLFTLPAAIENNMKRADYDLIINDYARVKNLFGKTEVAVFRKVLEETDKRILKFQNALHTRLQQPLVGVEEQKRLIRCLVNLEVGGDPAWIALSTRAKHLTEHLNQCKEQHIATEIELGKPKNSHTSKYKTKNPTVDYQTSPQRVLFVEEITEIISTSFPDLWRMGLSYFNGDLYVKPDSSKYSSFKHMVLTIIDTFCKTLGEAIIPHILEKKNQSIWPLQETDTIAAWLPHCLRYVRTTYSTLIKLDLPGEALDIIASLIQDLRMYCMSTLFKQTTEQIKQLYRKETWHIEYEGNHGGITDLPLQLEKHVHEVVQLVRESVLISEQRENPLLDSIASREFREFSQLIQNMLVAFSTSLEKLAFTSENSSDDDHSPIVSQLIGNPSVYRHDKNYTMPVFEQRLLTMLSNCLFTKQVILPRLKDLLTRNGYPLPVISFETAKSALSSLDKSIMEAYLEQKSDPLVGTIEPSMYLGRFDWDMQFLLNDISPYAKECINNLIGVHIEVHTISPNLVERVLTQIIETVAEELSRLMSCVKKFSVQGNQQARADILAIQETLINYSTPNAKSFFKEALDTIPQLEVTSTQRGVDDILKTFRTRMHLQIVCFSRLQQTNGPSL